MKSYNLLAINIYKVVLIIALMPGTVHALSISVFNTDDQQTQIDSWVSNLGGDITILEDFEGISVDRTMDWYRSLSTGVGTFTAEGQPGTGATSYNGINNPDSDDPYFSIQERDDSWYGRENTTPGGNQWLDSGDITRLSLTEIDSSLSNLFFYLQDPSDVRAYTTIGTTSYSHTFQPGQINGSSFFVGISLANHESLSQLSWTTTNTHDGYGLDDFGSVAPVPEPGTMLLLGTGLAGLAGLRLRKKK